MFNPGALFGGPKPILGAPAGAKPNFLRNALTTYGNPGNDMAHRIAAAMAGQSNVAATAAAGGVLNPNWTPPNTAGTVNPNYTPTATAPATEPAVGSYANTDENGYAGGIYPLRMPGRYKFLGDKPSNHPEARGDTFGNYWFWRWDLDPRTGLIKGEN